MTLRFAEAAARVLRAVKRLARVAAERHGLVAIRARSRRLTESLTDMVAPVWLIGGALIAVTMIGVGLNIVDMRGRTMDEKRDDITALGAVLAEQTYRYVQVIDLVLQDVQAHTQSMEIRTQEDFRVRLGGPDIHEYLKNRLKNLPQAHSIRFVGADGSMVNWSMDTSPSNSNEAARDYYRHFRETDDPGIFVSVPAKGYTTGAWTVFLARRITASDGGFLGIVVVAVDVQYLLDFYQTISRHVEFGVTLVRRDGIVLARYPDAAAFLGTPIPPAARWYKMVATNGGTYRSPGYLNGVPSIIAVTPLRDYPLVVDVGLSDTDSLAMWRRQAIFVSGVELAVIIAFLGLFGVIARQVRRQTAQHADLQRITHALRQSETRLRDFATTASDWFWEQDSDLRFTSVGEESPLWDRTDQSYVGKRRWERNDPTQAPEAWNKHIRDVTEHKPFSDFRYARTGPDGKVHYISVSGVPIHDEAGAFLGYRGTGRDITAQVEADLQILASKERAERAEAMLQDAIDSVSEGFVIYDQDDRLVLCNDAYRSRYATNATQMAIGSRYEDILRYGLELGLYVDAIGREEAWFDAWMRQHRTGTVSAELDIADGRSVLVTEGRMRNGSIAGLRIDITALKHAQAALRDSEARLDKAQRIARIGSWELDLPSGRYRWSSEMYRIRGLPAEGFEPRLDNLAPYIHPDDKPIACKWLGDLRAGADRGRAEFRIVRPDGQPRMVSVEGVATIDPDGIVRKVAGTMQDITERRLIEQQLMQAQKMEAIGNLTGGMAHDFNNLLGVIIGNLHLLSEAIEGDEEIKELCRDALCAARRGAELTRRLLAFGRRQSLQPQATDINQLVDETIKLLARMLGEDITVELKLTPGLRPTVVDPAQLEAAITNLVSNARDAMPNGGRLIIATSTAELKSDFAALHPDVVPGHYKVIQVTDTGTGMPPDVKAHIFEPFFTTKPQGKGTGLGLSMVFGFIKQSGGHVSVYSEPGQGTTVTLYLPYRPETTVPIAIAQPRSIVGGHETILLVEDNNALRRIVARQLAELGYAVTEADSADAALAILDRGKSFDLLLTDVVMPGELDGVDLAAAAAVRQPGLKVLLMSGFPEARFAQRIAGQVRPRLISKPFHRDVLAVALREVLDAPAGEPKELPVVAAAE